MTSIGDHNNKIECATDSDCVPLSTETDPYCCATVTGTNVAKPQRCEKRYSLAFTAPDNSFSASCMTPAPAAVPLEAGAQPAVAEPPVG